MHEITLFNSIIAKIRSISLENNHKKIRKITIRIGVFCPISKDHFIDHFNELSKGSVAEHAELIVIKDDNIYASYAQNILFESAEIDM